MFRKIGIKRRPLLICRLLSLLVISLLLAATAQGAELHRLAVVGVANKTGEGEFSNLLIAQGVAQLVAQELYDVGGFLPVEDNPEITGRINELLALSAKSEDGEAASDKALDSGKALGCEAVATVKIIKFSKSRSKGGIGPFSAAKVEITVELEISLKDGDKPVVSAKGRGTGVTKSQSVLFQVRQNKINFDQTSAGMATLEAVKEAVAKLPRS